MSTNNKIDNMPAPLEKSNHTNSMMLALKTVITRERDRKRLEEEMVDKMVERKKQEQERLRKKQEAESLTLEQTTKQILNLENKLKSLRGEKHDLFLQLKKVLNETENRRKQIKENEMRVTMNDYAALNHPHHPYMRGSHLLQVPGASLHGRPTMLGDKSHIYRSKTPPAPPVQGIKRTRSPSPPVVDLYPVQSSHYPAGTFGSVPTVPTSYRQQARGHTPYTSTQASSSTFISQAQSGAAVYPHRQQATLHSSFTSGSQSNPSKYPTREAHFAAAAFPHPFAIDSQGDHYPPGFQGYPAAAQHPQASLESSSKSSTYAEEQSHYQSKLPGQIRAVHAQALQSHQPLLQQQVAHLQQAQAKVLPASYQSRRKPDSPVYSQKKQGPHGAGYPTSQPGSQRSSSSYSVSQAHGQHAGGRFYVDQR